MEEARQIGVVGVAAPVAGDPGRDGPAAERVAPEILGPLRLAFGLRVVQAEGSALTYAGGWTRQNVTKSSGGAVRYSANSGATARLSVTARALAIAFSTGPTRGKADVYELPKAEQERISKVLRPIIDEWIKEMEPKGVPAREMLRKAGYKGV